MQKAEGQVFPKGINSATFLHLPASFSSPQHRPSSRTHSASTNMNIHIVAGSDKESSSVNVTGTIEHVITDQETTTFQLGDASLKDAVKSYFDKAPNDAYLHSPTPWNDLYKRYNWPETTTIITPIQSEILSITAEPVIVKTQTFSNNSDQKATFNVSVTDQVSNTVASSWSTGGSFTVGQKFTYGVSFLGSGGGGETSLSYTQSWGEGGQNQKTVTVGSSSGISVELDPGEGVIARLSADRGVMKVRICYRARLSGNTAINYNPTYKDHHFWSLGINGVMSAAEKVTYYDTVEDISVGYYSRSTVELVNARSGVVMGVTSADEEAGF